MYFLPKTSSSVKKTIADIVKARWQVELFFNDACKPKFFIRVP